jgi:hypothetical protein
MDSGDSAIAALLPWEPSSGKCLKRMAGTTGLEPAASAVTGQRSNQLNYVPTRQISGMWRSSRLDSILTVSSGTRKFEAKLNFSERIPTEPFDLRVP